MNDRFDFILVGGGLQNGLVAMALAHHQPEARVLMLEQSQTLGGNHTWSFHPDDLTGQSSAWIEPLIDSRWDGYAVHLGGWSREFNLAYSTISSSHFAATLQQLAAWSHRAAVNKKLANSMRPGSEPGSGTAVMEPPVRCQPGLEIRLGTKVDGASADHVTTEHGETMYANTVVDSRGPAVKREFALCGYQKFWGFEIETSQDWPTARPTLMDDRVDQADGFRFMYALPFEPRRILIEDTRFSDTPRLDRAECLSQVERYLSERGVRRWSIVREEQGVLPMPISPEATPGWFAEQAAPILGGYAGGWFHAATGYSVPLAVAVAETIATNPCHAIRHALANLASQHRRRNSFARFLNRLLFRLVAPSRRYQIFRRFYRVLNRNQIARFYAHQFTGFDAFRIVVGVPPSGLRPLRFASSFLPQSQESR